MEERSPIFFIGGRFSSWFIRAVYKALFEGNQVKPVHKSGL
jgi:hypothetical protein